MHVELSNRVANLAESGSRRRLQSCFQHASRFWLCGSCCWWYIIQDVASMALLVVRLSHYLLANLLGPQKSSFLFIVPSNKHSNTYGCWPTLVQDYNTLSLHYRNPWLLGHAWWLAIPDVFTAALDSSVNLWSAPGFQNYENYGPPRILIQTGQIDWHKLWDWFFMVNSSQMIAQCVQAKFNVSKH